jgi:lysylphosphatidylglycerol synthetase-like protein (DUF2156 family)
MKKFKSVFWWAGAAAFLFIFQLVYNHFGHGVTSKFMDTAWLVALIPLAIQLIYALMHDVPNQAWRRVWRWWNVAFWAIFFGQIVIGILAIAGTSSNLVIGYYVLAGVVFILGGISWFRKTH